MKITSAKRIISILLVILLTAFCIFSLIVVINFNDVDKSVYADPSISSQYYDLKNISLKDNGEPQNYSDTYNTYTRFQISNYTGLKAFAELINWNKVNFSGKYIKLSADIDCLGNTTGIGWYQNVLIGEDNRWFQGIEFDGDSHTIHNFKLNPNYFYGGIADAFGFFSRIDSQTTIKNLRLNNYTFSRSEETSQYGQAIGGIVGYLNGGTIQNCMVDGFNINAPNPDYNPITNYNKGMCLAGVFGVGNGTVRNCQVKNVTIDNYCYLAGIGPADCPYEYEMTGQVSGTVTCFFGTNPSTISNCVVQNIIGTNCLFSGNEDYDVAFPYYYYYKNLMTNKGDYNHTISNCQTSAGTSSVLDCSSEGGDGVSTWYYGGSGYNSGFPYLRQFINDWNNIHFISLPAEGGTISGNTLEDYEILVPSDATYSPSVDNNNATFALLEQVVTARANEGYVFMRWELKDDLNETYQSWKTLAAIFEKSEVGGGGTGGGGSEDPEPEPEEPNPKPDIPEGESELTIALKLGNGISYYYLDVENGSSIIIATITLGDQQYIAVAVNRAVKYKFEIPYYVRSDTKYYYNNYSVIYGGTVDYTGTYEDKEIEYMLEDTTIQIYYAISEYGVTFKKVENTTLYFNNYSMASDCFKYISRNTTITIDHVVKNAEHDNCETQAYIWGSNTVIYVADKGYKFKNPWNGTLRVTYNATFSPELELAQCTVTIAELGDYADTATLTISTPDEEDVSTTEPFAVEMGTIINFGASMDENGIFTYTYVFVYNETTIKTATYVMNDALYVMQFELDENEQREKLLNSLNGTGYAEQYTINGITTLTISPTFGLRQYFGGLG